MGWPFARENKGGSDLQGKSKVKISPQASYRLCWRNEWSKLRGMGFNLLEKHLVLLLVACKSVRAFPSWTKKKSLYGFPFFDTWWGDSCMGKFPSKPFLCWISDPVFTLVWLVGVLFVIFCLFIFLFACCCWKYEDGSNPGAGNNKCGTPVTSLWLECQPCSSSFWASEKLVLENQNAHNILWINQSLRFGNTNPNSAAGLL